jgi:Protein of unknown function, DUF488
MQVGAVDADVHGLAAAINRTRTFAAVVVAAARDVKDKAARKTAKIKCRTARQPNPLPFETLLPSAIGVERASNQQLIVHWLSRAIKSAISEFSSDYVLVRSVQHRPLQHSAERFLELLQIGGVNAVADVRSVPASRFCPWFSRKSLEPRLAREGIAYLPGGRPNDERLYRDRFADYEAIAVRPECRAGIDSLIDAAAGACVCLMCAEREPLDCHPCLLVARSLAARGLAIGHILNDGAIESHAAIEQRLLVWVSALDGQGDGCDLFATGQHERLAAAYRRRARAVAFRKKIPAVRGAVENR